MSARIAPELVNTALAAADYRSRATTTAGMTPPAGPALPEHGEPPPPRAADTLPALPLPPDPPGTMFAAAVMAGALAPRPTTPEEAFLRLGTVWRPPDSVLQLADREA